MPTGGRRGSGGLEDEEEDDEDKEEEEGLPFHNTCKVREASSLFYPRRLAEREEAEKGLAGPGERRPGGAAGFGAGWTVGREGVQEGRRQNNVTYTDAES